MGRLVPSTLPPPPPARRRQAAAGLPACARIQPSRLAAQTARRKKHISDKLVAAAAEAGIALRFIDKEQPLEAQGPFVAILQKVRKPGEPSSGWITRLAACTCYRECCRAPAASIGSAGGAWTHSGAAAALCGVVRAATSPPQLLAHRWNLCFAVHEMPWMTGVGLNPQMAPHFVA